MMNDMNTVNITNSIFQTYDEILTINELAEALKVGSTQAYKLVRSGKIKAFKSGKDWKISKVALIEYVRKESGLG